MIQEQHTAEVEMSTVALRKLRVKIAKDVLKQLSLRTIRPKIGNFVEMDGLTDFVHGLNTKNSKAVAATIQKTKNCETCALGACFLSLVKLNNEFDFSTGTRGEDVVYVKLLSRLLPVFGVDQMQLIEVAFELGSGYITTEYGRSQFNIHNTHKQLAEAESFGRKHDKETPRLRAIMQNIVKWQGEFVP